MIIILLDIENFDRQHPRKNTQPLDKLIKILYLCSKKRGNGRMW